MTRRLGALLLCVLLIPVPVSADESRDRTSPSTLADSGPLAKASRDAKRLEAVGARAEARQQQSARDERSWMQRHPVWTGALVGFATGFGLTMLSDDDGIIGRTAAGLVWGGVGAGAGAVIGWSLSRSEDWQRDSQQ